MRLRDEVAIIQGGTRGMGRRMAERFAAEGAKVVVTGRNEERGREVAKAIIEKGGEGRFVRVDIGHEDQIKRAVDETVDAYGKLTVVVNNAGATEYVVGASKTDGWVSTTTSEAFDKIIGTDLRGTWLSCKYAIPAMVDAGKGSIVNLSSVAAQLALVGSVAYSAAKAGIHAVTRSVAIENAAHKIRCNCIVSGTVPNWQTDFLHEPMWQKAFEAVQPIGMGTEDDLANAALFLASDEAAFITGVLLNVDGGWTAKMHLPEMPSVGGEFAAADDSVRAAPAAW